VVSHAQLVWAGLTPSTISRRVREGWLHRVYRGVYAVGHRKLTREGRWMAAVLACGPGAVLSHESAAHLWGVSPTSPSIIHVTVRSTNGRKKRRGIRIHYATTLRSADGALRHNTSHARTLRDLGYGPEPTKSQLERAFLSLCSTHGIPKPEVNRKIGPYIADFIWREQRLVVETDGWGYHSSRAAFEADRARDVQLQRRGFTVLRFTYRQVASAPAAVVDSLWAHLRR
jgi:very-short-patch-repair endonuclease